MALGGGGGGRGGRRGGTGRPDAQQVRQLFAETSVEPTCLCAYLLVPNQGLFTSTPPILGFPNFETPQNAGVRARNHGLAREHRPVPGVGYDLDRPLERVHELVLGRLRDQALELVLEPAPAHAQALDQVFDRAPASVPVHDVVEVLVSHVHVLVRVRDRVPTACATLGLPASGGRPKNTPEPWSRLNSISRKPKQQTHCVFFFLNWDCKKTFDLLVLHVASNQHGILKCGTHCT